MDQSGVAVHCATQFGELGRGGAGRRTRAPTRTRRTLVGTWVGPPPAHDAVRLPTRLVVAATESTMDGDDGNGATRVGREPGKPCEAEGGRWVPAFRGAKTPVSPYEREAHIGPHERHLGAEHSPLFQARS